MAGLITKFFSGWLIADEIGIESLNNWERKAKETEKEDCELIVFKAPKKHSKEIIALVEKMLQDNYKNAL